MVWKILLFSSGIIFKNTCLSYNFSSFIRFVYVSWLILFWCILEGLLCIRLPISIRANHKPWVKAKRIRNFHLSYSSALTIAGGNTPILSTMNLGFRMDLPEVLPMVTLDKKSHFFSSRPKVFSIFCVPSKSLFFPSAFIEKHLELNEYKVILNWIM